MGQSRKASRQQAMAERQGRKRRRLALFIAVPATITAIVVVVALTMAARRLLRLAGPTRSAPE